MAQSNVTNIAARLLVGFAAAAVVSRLFGPKAGILGTVAVLVAHEALDAPVAAMLDRALAHA